MLFLYNLLVHYVNLCYVICMKIGYIQYSPIVGDKDKNLETIKRLIKNNSGDIFVLPEMGTTGYTTNTKEELLRNAEPQDGFLVQELTKIAKENDTCLIVGMPEMIDGKVYNTSVVIGPDGLITKHQKSHLFMEEIGVFEPGQTKPTLFEWRGAKIGLGVCYDYMFPEFWRVLGLGGADLFVNTANFYFDYGFRVMQVRSIENGVFSITSNRTGTEDNFTYKGGSEIVDNTGKVIAKASEKEEEVCVVEVDLTLSRSKQWNKYNNLFGDRREDLY